MPHSNKKMISFFLTTKCNLCCRYCYNAKERNCIVEQTLNFEIAKNGIDWYFNNNPSRHIRFYGPGEPRPSKLGGIVCIEADDVKVF